MREAILSVESRNETENNRNAFDERMFAQKHSNLLAQQEYSFLRLMNEEILKL
jgi:uncharacterized protein YutD